MCLCMHACSENTERKRISLQILEYLNDNSEGLKSLNKHLLTKALFMKYNSTTPSSAPVERLFSLAGLTLITLMTIMSWLSDAF